MRAGSAASRARGAAPRGAAATDDGRFGRLRDERRSLTRRRFALLPLALDLLRLLRDLVDRLR